MAVAEGKGQNGRIFHFISQMLYFDFRHRQTYKLTDMLTDDAHYGTVNYAPLHI